MMKRWRELHAAIDRLSQQLDQLDRRTDKMETIIMVREPSSGAAAEAYEGLRRQVVASAGERVAHLKQLVQLDAMLTAGTDADSVGKQVRGWVEQASLERVSDPEHPDRDMLFEVIEDRGGPYEVLEPAYVDTITGRVIRRGSARRRAAQAGRDAADRPGQQAPWRTQA